MAKRNTSMPEAPIVRSWDQVDEWDGLTKGDTVVVKGERADFRFMYACSKNNEVIAITVFGDGQWRTFVPERVAKPVVKAKRVRKASPQAE